MEYIKHRDPSQNHHSIGDIKVENGQRINWNEITSWINTQDKVSSLDFAEQYLLDPFKRNSAQFDRLSNIEYTTPTVTRDHFADFWSDDAWPQKQFQQYTPTYVKVSSNPPAAVSPDNKTTGSPIDVWIAAEKKRNEPESLTDCESTYPRSWSTISEIDKGLVNIISSVDYTNICISTDYTVGVAKKSLDSDSKTDIVSHIKPRTSSGMYQITNFGRIQSTDTNELGEIRKMLNVPEEISVSTFIKENFCPDYEEQPSTSDVFSKISKLF